MVIVDRLTKSTLFLPIKMTDSIDKLAKIYINKVVRLHGIPVSIVSNRDLKHHGDKIGYEHCVSPPNQWLVRKSHPSIRRSPKSIYIRI
jgi:hypothetical protein